jgi:hypothetical protein
LISVTDGTSGMVRDTVLISVWAKQSDPHIIPMSIIVMVIARAMFIENLQMLGLTITPKRVRYAI